MDLSIIIISYNTKRLLETCLESVTNELLVSHLNAEVIVVDNHSNDGSVEMIEKFKRFTGDRVPVTLLCNSTNIGFGKANNQAAKIARGRFFVFLNSDTVTGERTMEEMVKFLDRRLKVGIASCRLNNPDGTIQPQGGSLPRLSTVAIWALFLDDIPLLHQILPSYQLRRSSLSTGSAKRLGWVAGTAMWVRREAWEEIGGFDESIFMYGEDVDLCYRAQQAGWGVMINPAAAVVHRGRASGSGSDWITAEVEGLMSLFSKYKPAWESIPLRLILRLGMGLRWLLFGILRRNEQLKKGYAKALRSI